MLNSSYLTNDLLSVKNLSIQIDNIDTNFFPVQDVNIDIQQNKIFALVGESGSGKTLTALSLLGLLPKTAKWVQGEIIFQNQKIDINSQHLLHKLRGKQISFIFQNAQSALNPVFCVGRQIQDVITTNLNVSSKVAKKNVLDLFEQVNFLPPKKIFKLYPHQLSGGMAQRVMIAMALSCNPRLIFADEPTTALDVTTQISILQLINTLKLKHRFSVLLISHDLQVVSALADKIAVMKNGRIVECSEKENLLNFPQHDYTKILLSPIRHNQFIQKESSYIDQ